MTSKNPPKAMAIWGRITEVLRFCVGFFFRIALMRVDGFPWWFALAIGVQPNKCLICTWAKQQISAVKEGTVPFVLKTTCGVLQHVCYFWFPTWNFVSKHVFKEAARKLLIFLQANVVTYTAWSSNNLRVCFLSRNLVGAPRTKILPLCFNYN